MTTSTETVLDEKQPSSATAEDIEDDDNPGVPDDSQPTMTTRQVSAIHIIVTRGQLPSPL